jgi:hypothetical protein
MHIYPMYVLVSLLPLVFSILPKSHISVPPPPTPALSLSVQFRERCKKVIGEILARFEGERLLLVTHASVIEVLKLLVDGALSY